MTAFYRATVRDLTDHLRRWSNAGSGRESMDRYRQAVRSAYQILSRSYHWSYLAKPRSLAIDAPYSTGTVEYTHSTLAIDLSGGTWPTWASYGVIEIEGGHYEVASRESGTRLLLSSGSNPGADVSSGTSFTLRHDRYPLPSDFLFLGPVCKQAAGKTPLERLRPMQFDDRKVSGPASGEPRYLSLFGDEQVPNGGMLVRLYPYPDFATSLSYTYQRQPRGLALQSYTAGRISTTSASAIVTGDSSQWTDRLIGSILRISFSSRDANDEIEEDESRAFFELQFRAPWVHERRITDVSSSTSLTVDTAIPETLSSVSYEISDPLDLEGAVMFESLFRCAEWQLGVLLARGDSDGLRRIYEESLQEAIAAEEARDLSGPMGIKSTSFGRQSELSHAAGRQ